MKEEKEKEKDEDEVEEDKEEEDNGTSLEVSQTRTPEGAILECCTPRRKYFGQENKSTAVSFFFIHRSMKTMFYLLSSSLYGSNPYYDVMVEIFIIFFFKTPSSGFLAYSGLLS